MSHQADVFFFDITQTPNSGRVEVDDDFTDNVDDFTYGQIRAGLLSDDLVDNAGPDYPSWLDQTGYSGELHAFLAWESDGSYWDLDALNSTNELAYRETFIDDVFNKIARQVADFSQNFFAIDNFDPQFVNGDFNGDGIVNANDFDYIGGNWQQGPNPPT